MTWKDMTDEILRDIVMIQSQCFDTNPVEHIVAMVQWRGKEYSTRLFQPSPFELVGDGGITTGMSIMPEPPTDWFRCDIGWVPKVDGNPSAEDMPLAYYVIGAKGSGVMFASRFNKGWILSPEHIDLCRDRLLVAGVWKFKP